MLFFLDVRFTRISSLIIYTGNVPFPCPTPTEIPTEKKLCPQKKTLLSKKRYDVKNDTNNKSGTSREFDSI